MAQALDGVRVLDLSRYIAGPYCGLLLADLGAEVISIEPPEGSPTRSVGPFLNGQSTYFAAHGRNKKGITLNLRATKGAEVFRKLAAKSDVLVHNFRPGVMERLGFAYPGLRELNPRLVVVCISGFGQDGPYGAFPGFDNNIQAMSGLMSVTGEPDGPPGITGTWVADYVTAIYSALGVVAALYHRGASGCGQLVDVSMLESMVSLLSTYVVDYLVFGTNPERMGNQDRYGAPCNVFHCRDGYIQMDASMDHLFLRLLHVMGKDELAADPRFTSNQARLENLAVLDALVEEWTSKYSREELSRVLASNGVPAGAVRTIPEVVRCPQLQHRGQLVSVPPPELGEIPLLNLPLHFSDTPTKVNLPTPTLGEHNEEVYTQLLDYSLEELASWKREAII
ncbi:MAG: CaiB/BaiF CoA transferase family protein [Chloroflexota bacterium]